MPTDGWRFCTVGRHESKHLQKLYSVVQTTEAEYSEACLESTFLTADSLVPINSGPSLVNFVRSRSRSPKGQDGRAFYSLKHALF